MSQLASDPVLRFERRHCDRWEAHGAASAIRVGGERFGEIHELRLIDFSDDGMGAVCDTVIEPGTTICVGFQHPGLLAKRGTVLRCVPCGEGYQVGIQFQGRLAA